MSATINTEEIYESLKDFQKDTVDFAYEKLKQNGRYLVADEVGLGKTLIAKGIIAKTYDELKNKKDKIEIVYITTNQSIASQNIETLRIGNSEATSHRLTLHATKSKENKKINFMSFTVGTSIEIRGSGSYEEREFLVYLLRHEKYGLLKGIREKSIWKFFKQGSDKNKIFEQDNNFKISKESLAEKFSHVKEEFVKNFCASVENNHEIRNLIDGIRNLNNNLHHSHTIIEILRKLLLIENLNNIQADLIIMDEFQRFNQVLLVHNEEKQVNDGLKDILEILFSQNTKVLLLSATPYKLLDCKNNEHYDEFYNLIKWLQKSEDKSKITKLKSLFSNLYRNENNKKEIEDILKKIMCRTERISYDYDNFEEIEIKNLKLNNTMKHYFEEYKKYTNLDIQGVTRYLKSAPSALNYMKQDAYIAKRDFIELDDDVKSNIKENKNHPKLKMLNQEVENQRLKEFIWMPPLTPYVKARGISQTHSTKMLIFSQWDFVPDSIVGSFSIKERKRVNNYTNIKSFKDREKLLTITTQDIFPYDYDGILNFTELVKKTMKEYHLSKLDAKILLGSPANVIYRSILKYGNIDAEIIKKLTNYDDEDWHISESFLHFLGRDANYKKLKIENPKNKLIEILNYCIKHNIQSMMDEYIHQLTDAPSYNNINDDNLKMEYLYNIFETVFKLALNRVECWHCDINNPTKIIKTSKFAMRISKSSIENRKSDDNHNNIKTSADNVKTSFNSPFAPFILATTSIGQEGLDFHPYCHQIWHWDLPSNPVDLEQREGRINRYKNYAVRKNIAKAFDAKCWIEKFKSAKLEKGCDFQTYWIFSTINAEQKIERVIPLMPLSKEYRRYEHLKNQLKLYRTAIGQREQAKIMQGENKVIQISLKPPKIKRKINDHPFQ